MDIRFCFADQSKLAGWEHTRDFGGVSRGDILWHFFPGDISIFVGREGIETTFGWVPALHFALSMVHVCETLQGEVRSSSRYIFTEADECITFDRDGENVSVGASFKPIRLSDSLGNLCSAVADFANRSVCEVGWRYPTFLDTEVAREVASAARRLN